MRFRAPPRQAVAPSTFEQPAFAALRPWRDLLQAAQWPTVDAINRCFEDRHHGITGRPLQLVTQTPALADDGLHYESRIFQHGQIATRADCWHDLLNALVWLAYGDVKSALNARQASDVAAVGHAQRTRGQCALTHFDEAGIVLLLKDRQRLLAWDEHDWCGLFCGLTEADFAVAVVGHALLEHALANGQMLVGKALVCVHPSPAQSLSQVLMDVARGIAAGALLADPQELRPLPLVGLPGWHPQAGQPAFLRSAECFRPKRVGRAYPAPLETSVTSLNAAA
jgi:hypothetical protein